MRTRQVIIKVRNYRDYYGFDIVNASELKTKHDCVEALESHKRWLEEANGDALREVDRFITELGLEGE